MRGLLVCACILCGGCDDERFDLDAGDTSAAGGQLVALRGCPRCHASGDGALAGQSISQPGTGDHGGEYGGNLTPDVATGIGGWADLEIVRAIRYGVGRDEVPLCPSATRYPDMSDAEARAIVAYLRALPAVHRAPPPSYCPPTKLPPSLAPGGG